MNTKIHIGLDVHKKSIVTAYAHGDGSPPVHHGMFLLRNGKCYTGKTNWTHSHMNYLRAMTLPDKAQQIVLEEWSGRHDSAEPSP